MAGPSRPTVSGLEIEPTTLYFLYRKQAELRPGAPAIVSPGRPTLSFEDLLEQIDQFRHFMAANGVGRGHNIGVAVRARDLMAVVHSAVQSNATSVPINHESTGAELSAAARDFDLAALITDLPGSAQLMGMDIPLISVAWRADSRGIESRLEGDPVGPARQMEDPVPGDIATLLYTSGSTAGPKMVPQTHINRATAAISASQALKVTPEDRCLNVMPLFHTAGLHQELAGALVSGASVILADFDPPSLPELLREYQPTWLNLTPAMYALALPHLRNAGFKPGELALRFVRTGSAFMSDELRQGIEAALHVPLVNAYGSSETSFMAMTELPPGVSPHGSVGRPHSGVRLVNDEGDDVETGGVGEIWVEGPTVITEYYRNPEATAERFSDGWFKTGDTGYVDKDGFLFLTGRIGTRINRGGEKISPEEIESVLAALDGIEQVAVFGADHPELGQEVSAVCKLSDDTGVTPEQIRKYASTKLTWAKVPKSIRIVDRLPVSGTGKILRSELPVIYGSEYESS